METTTKDLKRRFMRTKGAQWCAVKVEYQNGRLSVTGAYGDVVTKTNARKMAIDYWESYFEDDRAAQQDMEDRFDTSFKNARSAARFVVNTDGEYHGLDV